MLSRRIKTVVVAQTVGGGGGVGGRRGGGGNGGGDVCVVVWVNEGRLRTPLRICLTPDVKSAQTASVQAHVRKEPKL